MVDETVITLDERGFIVLPVLVIAGPYVELVPCEGLDGKKRCYRGGLAPKTERSVLRWCKKCRDEFYEDPDAYK